MRCNSVNSDRVVKININKPEKARFKSLEKFSTVEQGYTDKANQANRVSIAMQLVNNPNSVEEIKAVLATIPEHVPHGVNIHANMVKAASMNLFGFYHAVRNGMMWDFKQLNSKYADFGNWHYGLMARSFGLSETMAKVAAGAAQMIAGTSPKESAFNAVTLFSDKNHGDADRDQRMIERGYKANERRKSSSAKESDKKSTPSRQSQRAKEPRNDRNTVSNKLLI